MNIIDEQGAPRPEAWMIANFGPVTILSPPNLSHTYELTELRARTGHASIIVKVLDNTGHPLPHIPTVWHWPDAPDRPNAGWKKAGVIATTNEQGVTGHAMGGGAYYSPPTQGPHAIWIEGEHTSQMISGLGMIAGTNHRHLDITFQDRTGSPQPPPPPPPPPPDLEVLHTILDLIRDARNLLATYINQLED